jgi:antitoxin MazE
MGSLLGLVVNSKSRYPLCRYKEEPMRTRIQKWGNSLALRIPKSFAAETHLEQGTLVEVSLPDGKLLVTPLSPPAITLEELLKHVTPHNLHHEVDTGPAVGGEVW